MHMHARMVNEYMFTECRAVEGKHLCIRAVQNLIQIEKMFKITDHASAVHVYSAL